MIIVEKIKVHKEQGMPIIDLLYVRGEGLDGYIGKEVLYDITKDRPGAVRTGQYPYPIVLPAKSARGQKYVRSKPDRASTGNLSQLPLS